MAKMGFGPEDPSNPNSIYTDKTVKFSFDLTGYEISVQPHDRSRLVATPVEGKSVADPIFDDFLSAVRDLGRVKDFRISNFCLNEGHIASINSLKELDCLVLRNVGATVETFSKLRLNSYVRRLTLSNNQLDQPPDLAGMRKLTRLSLKDNPITDSGLSLVGTRCAQIAFLDLSGTAVTDDGIQYLLGLPELRDVRLYNTKVTQRGLAPLSRHPNGKPGHLTVWMEKEKTSDAGKLYADNERLLLLVQDDRDWPIPILKLMEEW
jgi:Leucine-rich repeat (LRR) protein